MKENRPSNSMVDILKFAAALLVIIVHTNPLDQTSHAANHLLVQGLCRLVVPFFFCVSGYYFARGLSRPDAVPRAYLRRNLSRLLVLYCIWSLVYFPFDLIEIMQRDTGLQAAGLQAAGLQAAGLQAAGLWPALREYAGNFLLSGSHLQLWFLPALALAMALSFPFIVSRNITPLLSIAFLLYLAGMLGDSWYGLLRGFPSLQAVVDSYLAIFDTTRNGLFFGSLFVGLGARIALHPPALSRSAYLAGFCVFLPFVFAEAVAVLLLATARDFNMYVSVVPATYFLTRWATGSPFALSPHLSRYFRETSMGIFVSHGLFLVLFQLVLPMYEIVPSNLALCCAVLVLTVGSVTVFYFLKSPSSRRFSGTDSGAAAARHGDT